MKRREFRERAEHQHGYYDYMRSSEWQEKRMQRLMMDGFRCQMCGSGTNLQVHHISYDNLRKDAEIDDLVTLCKTCHEKVHSTDLERKANPSTVSPLYIVAVHAIKTMNRADAGETMQNFDTILLMIVGAIICWTLGRLDGDFSQMHRNRRRRPKD